MIRFKLVEMNDWADGFSGCGWSKATSTNATFYDLNLGIKNPS